MKYAENTIVPVEQSQIELQTLLKKYGANKFGIDWETMSIFFELHTRKVKISIPIPNKSEFEYTPKRIRRNPDQIEITYQKAIRQRWRALILVIKAKLEAIESQITTLDHEFLSYYIMQNGQTLAENIIPRLNQPDLFPKLPENNPK